MLFAQLIKRLAVSSALGPLPVTLHPEPTSARLVVSSLTLKSNHVSVYPASFQTQELSTGGTSLYCPFTV